MYDYKCRWLDTIHPMPTFGCYLYLLIALISTPPSRSTMDKKSITEGSATDIKGETATTLPRADTNKLFGATGSTGRVSKARKAKEKAPEYAEIGGELLIAL